MYEEITDVNPGELAREINGVKYYNPMMIYPAIHYTMGGILGRLRTPDFYQGSVCYR